MNADPQAGPWMPRIQQLPKLVLWAFSSLVVQRRTPTWGHRPTDADYVAESR
jgi:hypothetical protein